MDGGFTIVLHMIRQRENYWLDVKLLDLFLQFDFMK
jgi:hypothetical protein